MNIYEKKSLDCKIGIKAFQNINAAYLGFTKLGLMNESTDEVLLPSIFQWSVIRYSKPFLDSKIANGKSRYPIKHLKKMEGFSNKLHEHILTIRNTLIAHDDFTEIPPRVLKFGFNIDNSNLLIPTSIVISNKCISFPSEAESVTQMRDHAKFVNEAIYSKLMDDIVELRNIHIKYPELSGKDTGYKKSYGKTTIKNDEATTLNPPNFMPDEWLDNPTPDFSNINNGYKYEEAVVRRDFQGPETILLPNGTEIDIAPIKDK